LLWQIFLLVGSRYEEIRRFLASIRSITTDFGTERLLSGMPDLLPSFCKAVNIELPRDFKQQRWLFPRAIQAPCWMHMMDTLLMRSLISIRWFPLFLERLKSLLKFFREHTADIQHDLDALGLNAVVALLGTVTFPYFAKWRWKPLHDVCKAVGGVINTFRRNYASLSFVTKLKDQKLVKQVQDTLQDRAWASELDFVSWQAEWITNLQRWGGSCTCHAAEYSARATVICQRKGRLLHVAHQHAEATFANVLAEAGEWLPERFSGSIEFLGELQGVVKMTVALGRDKLDFLTCIPYLFCRLNEAGIRDEVLRQWDSVLYCK
jgi:hypothetical protein